MKSAIHTTGRGRPPKLTHKLQRYGIQGSTLTWIASFLSDRQQAVVVDGYQSSYISVRSGVPQGSVLGPCLFLAYINDLPDKLTALARLFADDTAVYKTVLNSEQQDQLQQDLQRLSEWEKSWDMLFHPQNGDALQDPPWTSTVPHHQEQTSPTPT